MRILSVSLFTTCLIAFSQASTADEIPLKINVGVGVSEYTFHDAYDSGNAYIYGTELELKAVVEKETITKYKDKVPAKFRKAAGKLDEVAVGHWAVPKSLFIHPGETQSAFGATWGIVPGFSTGFKYLKLGINAGVIASYMYMHNSALNETVHFIRPGLRGGLSLAIPMFDKMLTLEAGTQHDAYIPQTFFGSKSTWYVSSTYAMLHVRIPFSVKANI